MCILKSYGVVMCNYEIRPYKNKVKYFPLYVYSKCKYKVGNFIVFLNMRSSKVMVLEGEKIISEAKLIAKSININRLSATVMCEDHGFFLKTSYSLARSQCFLKYETNEVQFCLKNIFNQIDLIPWFNFSTRFSDLRDQYCVSEFSSSHFLPGVLLSAIFGAYFIGGLDPSN